MKTFTERVYVQQTYSRSKGYWVDGQTIPVDETDAEDLRLMESSCEASANKPAPIGRPARIILRESKVTVVKHFPQKRKKTKASE